MIVKTTTLVKALKCVKKHKGMYEKGISFKAFYGKTVLKKEFQSKL